MARIQAGTLDWIKAHRLTLRVQPFSIFDGGDSLSPELALMLGLTADEYDRVNAAIRQTRERYTDLAVHAATVKASADGSTLEVKVPSLATSGDSLYSDLLNTLTQVLGPERFQLFNSVAGDAFDASFDRFGSNPVTYTLKSPSNLQNGAAPVYQVTRNSIGADGRSAGSSIGAFNAATLQKNYPVLARLIPPSDGK